MKIIFICGSLEPGKDGVGDYTRRLCAYIHKQGIEVGILALNDKFIDAIKEEQQYADNESISCYRLPNTNKTDLNSKLAKAWVDVKNPQWLSLQFVPYAFHKKGLPFGLVKQLKYIGKHRNWQTMFHELWLGLNMESSQKEKIIGHIQRFIIKGLILKIKPSIINTQSQLYYNELNRLNLNREVQLLPLHSNIPIVKKKKSFLSELKGKIIFVVFGSVRKGAPLNEFIEEFVAYFNLKKGLKGVLVLIGRSGNEQKRWANGFLKKNIDVRLLGEMSIEEISAVFQDSHYGITTTPLQLIEKSGAVAAMREHKLPIIIVSKKWVPKNKFSIDLPDSIMEYSLGNFSDLMEKKINSFDYLSIENVASQLLDALNLKSYNSKG